MIEKISEWRQALRGQSANTRRKWYYEHKLIPSLRTDVITAEQARQQNNHPAVENLFHPWGQNAPLIFRKMRERYVLYDYGESVSRGLHGMARIEHVDGNTQLKNATARSHVIYAFGAGQRVKSAEILRRDIPINPGNKTIDNNPINWKVEILQDRARTMELTGQKDLADRYLTFAIWKLTDDATTAGQSARNVCLARRASLTHDLYYMNSSISGAIFTFPLEGNVERLKTLSKWAIARSLSPLYRGTPQERLQCLTNGLRGLKLTR